MSTTVTLAGNIVEDPELLYTRDREPFREGPGSWSTAASRTTSGSGLTTKPTPHNVTVYGSAANHLHDSAGTGDPIIVHGQLRTESWADKDTGEKRTKNVVVVDNRFGEVGVSLKYAAARIERSPQAAAQAS